jgi:hypothetical protein
MRELLENLKSLLSDIHAMQDKDPDWFGPFSDWNKDINDYARIEWPNLAISVRKVRTSLAEFESTPESEIRMGLGSSFIGQVMDIQNLMKEDRESELRKLLRAALNNEDEWKKKAHDFLEEFG